MLRTSVLGIESTPDIAAMASQHRAIFNNVSLDAA
jgi:hypothetical protein